MLRRWMLVAAGSLCVACATTPTRDDRQSFDWTRLFAEVLVGLLGPKGGWPIDFRP